jgi:hypothetical protein
MKRFTPPEEFQPNSLQTGAFSHLRTLFNIQHLGTWPSTNWFKAHLNAVNENGLKITFIDDQQIDFGERYYEQVIFDTGQVPTRSKNWHDLFGGFIWCLFPKTKALINKRHVDEIAIHGTKQRSKHRNALTLFDECGVILAVSDTNWQQWLRNHQWTKAFIDERVQWGKTIAPFMFGHANYEMLTKPYIGLTGKALFVNVPINFFEQNLSQQYEYLDNMLYEMIKVQDCLKNNNLLSPLPILGVPGWHDANNCPDFYNNTDYFRVKTRNQK